MATASPSHVLLAIDPRRYRRSRVVLPCRTSACACAVGSTVPWAAVRETARGLSSFFYFLNLIKAMQIQKFVQVWFELRKM
jgi:hypothetical protein